MTDSPYLDDPDVTSVDCPQCGAPQAVRPTTVMHPEDAALEELCHGTLNQVTCTTCGAAFRLCVPLIFRDDESRYLVYFVGLDSPGEWEEAESRMQELAENAFSGDDDYGGSDFRLTVTRNTFIEKVFIHQHELDDKLVEYVKYQLYQNSSREIDPVRSELLYDFSGQDGGTLAFLVIDRESGRATAGAHIPMDVYEELADTFVGDRRLQDELDSLFPGYFVSVDRLM